MLKGVYDKVWDLKWWDDIRAPLKAKKPWVYRISCDLFDGIPHESLDEVFAVMALSRRHTFQIITYCPERAANYWTDGYRNGRGEHTDMYIARRAIAIAESLGWTAAQIDEVVGVDRGWPSNVWAGVPVVNQECADRNISLLLKVPATVRFLNMEPLLGPVDLSEWMYTLEVVHNGDGDTQEVPCRPDIHWVVVGGESGPGARPMHPMWARTIKNQCEESGVPFFFNQWGDFGPDQVVPISFTQVWSGVSMDEPASMFRVGKKRAGRLLDGREWNEMPGVASPC